MEQVLDGPAATGFDLSSLREYVRLRQRQSELEAEAGAVKEEANRVEQTLLEAFARESVQRMRVDGRTVYIERKLAASARGEGEALVAALRECDLGHFVRETCHPSTLAAYVRDLDREGESLPEPLVEIVHVEEVYRLKIRRSA